MIKWFKIYYWNVMYDMPKNMKRPFRDKIRWLFLFPYYRILAILARAGLIDTQEGYYMRLRDFTPFFWRTLIKRAVAQERKHLRSQSMNPGYALDQIRLEAQKEVWDYLEQKIDEDFRPRL